MAESSRRSKKRRSKRKERRSELALTPPSYSVRENSEGELVNDRLNLKWPDPGDSNAVGKHRYLALADPPSESDGGSSRRNRKKRSKKEKKRGKSKRSPRVTRSPKPAEKEAQYITLSTGSEAEDSSDRSKRRRRERKCNVVQTSPQVSRKSYNGFATDDDGKKIDSVVFDTRSEMMRYKKRDDIVPSRRRATRSKKPSAAEQRENEEYNRYYVGVKSRRSVENGLKCPGEFALYYEKPRDGELPATINLKIAYFSSGSQEYHHYPIQHFAGTDGHDHYVVMQNRSDGKMFTSILSLVKHYSLYSHVDTATGRLETFSVPH